MSGRIIRQEVSDMLELPEVGRLHIGIKSEKGYPQSIDYFRPTGKYAPIFQSSLGDKPQTIQIIFPSDDAGAPTQRGHGRRARSFRFRGARSG